MSWWYKGPVTKHTLTVTASSDYDKNNAKVVPVNTETPINICSDLADIELLIRIKDFSGSSKHGNYPKESEYFKLRESTNVSLQLSMTPKCDIEGESLLFGNDFDYPIKGFLPYGTGAGLKLFTSYVDPSVEGDVYADEPFLYGKALTSFNIISDKSGKIPGSFNGVLEEDLSIDQLDSKSGVERQAFFRDADHLKKFIFKEGVTYQFDFFSGFISLKGSDIQVSLPGGFELNMSRYLNDNFNSVRFVLKMTQVGEEIGVSHGKPLIVVNFELEAIDNEPEDESDEVVNTRESPDHASNEVE